MRLLVMLVVLLSAASESTLAQGNQTKTNTLTAVCTFTDEKELSVRYDPSGPAKKNNLPSGELWPPSGSPMYLFTQTELSLNKTEIPAGAYSMYLIPDKEKWTLIVNKSVSAGAPYDQQQDLLRVPMEIGQLSQGKPRIKVVFGHLAPRQCNMRIYYGKTGAWAEFKEK
jgi:hypothetical protein